MPQNIMKVTSLGILTETGHDRDSLKRIKYCTLMQLHFKTSKLFQGQKKEKSESRQKALFLSLLSIQIVCQVTCLLLRNGRRKETQKYKTFRKERNQDV
jgi:hypothetical protein